MGFKTFILARRSEFTGKVNEMALPLSRDEFLAAFKKWQEGALIQNAFPTLNTMQREFIKSGVTQEEWDAHINPIVCQTCKRRMDEDYTIGCPECFEHEHAEEEEEHDGGEKGEPVDGAGCSEEAGQDSDGRPQLP